MMGGKEEGRVRYLKSPFLKSYTSRSSPHAAIAEDALGYPAARFSPWGPP